MKALNSPYSAISARYTRGGVLIGVLIFSLIIALLVGGIFTFVLSHNVRVIADSNYAAALNMAEAGVNYEINKLCTNPSQADQKYLSGGTPAPLTSYQIPIPGQSGAYLPGSFTVCVRASNPNDPNDTTAATQPWSSPQPVLIEATGTVPSSAGATPIQRTVWASGYSSGAFASFTVFSITSTVLRGSSTFIDGCMGTNGSISASGHPTIYSSLTFYGYPAGSYSQTATGGVYYQPNPIIWPTVSQVADSIVAQKTCTTIAAGTGLTWLTQHNDNDKIQVFASGDASNVTNPPSDLRTSAGATTSSYDLSALFPKQKDGNPGDASGGNRYACPSVTYSFTNPSNSETVGGYGLKGCNVLILSGDPSGPRDYYFEHIGGNGNQAILIDNAKGMVRLWLGDTAGSDGGDQSDSMPKTVLFTSTDPSKFRLYDNKSATLSIDANATFCGGIYNFRGYDYNGNAIGTISCNGNPAIVGSVIAGNISISGNPCIIAPNGPWADPSDMNFMYGFGSNWQEKTPQFY